jgi:UMF1 family MFS transporter
VPYRSLSSHPGPNRKAGHLDESTSAIPIDDRATIRAWCFYDWANSAFTTLVVTFIYASYFTQTFAADAGAGTALWSRGIVISSILIALLAPLLGAAADRGGARRRFLVISTTICIVATALLAFVSPTQPNAVFIAMSLFIIANVAFEVGIVFYNAFLPEITSPERIGRVSGNGWGLGYAGGLVCLVIALFGFVGLGGDPLIRLSTENGFNVRATNLLVAVWFLIFSIPAFLKLRDRSTQRPKSTSLALFEILPKQFAESAIIVKSSVSCLPG